MKLKEKTGTQCFTYNVNLVVQILAENEEVAREKLDKEGGYITTRDVQFLDSVYVYNSKSKEKN